MAVGAFVVELATPELLTAIVSAIGGWLAGRQQRMIKLEIDGDAVEVRGLSSARQRQLIDEWLRRQAGD